MDLLSTWRSLYKLRYCPVALIQTAFAAGTVYLLMAIQASSGTRIAHKDLRHSLDQKTLVQQYLKEIGLSWNCATIISGTLDNLMNEQVRPLLHRLDRNSISATAGLHIPADIGDDEEENGSSRSRSSSRKWTSTPKKTPQISRPHTMSSGSGQQISLSTPLKHVLISSSPTQIPLPADPLISPSLTTSITKSDERISKDTY